MIGVVGLALVWSKTSNYVPFAICVCMCVVDMVLSVHVLLMCVYSIPY